MFFHSELSFKISLHMQFSGAIFLAFLHSVNATQNTALVTKSFQEPGQDKGA